MLTPGGQAAPSTPGYPASPPSVATARKRSGTSSSAALYGFTRRAFAVNLKEERTEQGLSEVQLGRRLARIGEAYVSMIEARERTPSLGVIAALAYALGVEPETLLR